jgi:ketosteroid isomerase-like protein
LSFADRVREPRPRALDLGELGTRRHAVDEWSEWAHPDIEIVTVGGPEPSSHTGLASAAPHIENFLSLWEDYRVQAEEYLQVNDERTLVLTLQSGRGKSSGVEIRQRRASLFHVRGGKVTRRINYWHRDRALADLGLGELAVSQENVEE